MHVLNYIPSLVLYSVIIHNTRLLISACCVPFCSKSIWRNFFPWKIMKYVRCAVVGRWRVPSCPYVDFFPPADSVSRVQPACEWECICSARRIVIFCENVISWLKSSPLQLHYQVGDQLIIARSHVRRVGCLSYHRNVVFGKESLNQLRHEFHGHFPQGQIIGQNGMYRTSAYPPPPPQVLGRWHDGPAWTKSALGQWARHFSLLRAHQNKCHFNRRVGIFESVVPLINLCDAHAIIAKTHWIFQTVSTWLSPSFWQNLMQYRCSSRSVIFADCDVCCVYTLTHMLAARDWCYLLAGKDPHTHMKVPSISLPKHTSRSSLVSAEKNHVGYFLNRVVLCKYSTLISWRIYEVVRNTCAIFTLQNVSEPFILRY